MPKSSTRLSSRGQVVIPAWVRRELDLRAGDELAIELGPAGQRTILLCGPAREEMERLLERGYRWFRRTGRDLVEELHEARRRERARERERRDP